MISKNQRRPAGGHPPGRIGMDDAQSTLPLPVLSHVRTPVCVQGGGDDGVEGSDQSAGATEINNRTASTKPRRPIERGRGLTDSTKETRPFAVGAPIKAPKQASGGSSRNVLQVPLHAARTSAGVGHTRRRVVRPGAHQLLPPALHEPPRPVRASVYFPAPWPLPERHAGAPRGLPPRRLIDSRGGTVAGGVVVGAIAAAGAWGRALGWAQWREEVFVCLIGCDLQV